MNKDVLRIINTLAYECKDTDVRDLLNPDLGVTVLKPKVEVAMKDLCVLQSAILNEKNHDMRLSPNVGDIYQDFYQKVDFRDRRLIDALAERMGEIITDEVYKRWQLTPSVPIMFDSAIIQYYALSKMRHPYAIPPHYDHKGFVEIVAIVLVEGEPLFFTAKDKFGNAETEVDAKPMDIILMRGYGFNGRDSRPIHYVKKIRERRGRTSLTFRIYSKNKEHLETIRKAFSIK